MDPDILLMPHLIKLTEIKLLHHGSSLRNYHVIFLHVLEGQVICDHFVICPQTFIKTYDHMQAWVDIGFHQDEMSFLNDDT